MCSSGYCAGDVAARRVRSVVSPGGEFGQAPDPVELRLEPPPRVVERLPSALGEHRLEPPGAGISGAVLRAREEREPVCARLHEVELEARVAAAVQHERDLRVGPLDRLVPAVVEDAHLARAVVALRGSCPRTSRTRAGGPRSAPPGACRPSRWAGPWGPPSSGAPRRVRAARRSGARSRGACGSRTSCPSRSAISPGAGSVVPSGRSRAAARTRTASGSFDAAAISSRRARGRRGRRGAGERARHRVLVLGRDVERLERLREVVHRPLAHRREQVAERARTVPTRCRSGSRAARTRPPSPRPT